MKIFISSDFTGVQPVGTSALVLAENEQEAKQMLLTELKKIGLGKNEDFTLQQIKNTKQTIIINNGDY